MAKKEEQIGVFEINKYLVRVTFTNAILGATPKNREVYGAHVATKAARKSLCGCQH